MPQNDHPTEQLIAALIDESTGHSGRGDWAAAISCVRRAVELAGGLVADAVDDEHLRHGLGGLLYRLGSLYLADRDPAAAVTALDAAVQAYASLGGTGADAALLRADALARRGLAQSVRGRAASAAVDADEAVVVYLAATRGDPTSDRRRDLARVLATNAATLASDGDPQLAVASANAALGYFGCAEGIGDDGEPVSEVDSGYVYSAAVVSALVNFADARVAEGFLPATLIAANLPADQDQQALQNELKVINGLLSAGGPVSFPLDFSRDLARLVLSNVRGRGLLWLPPDEWVDRPLRPTLTAALHRHAAACGDGPLADELTGLDRPELAWTTSMRWLSGMSPEVATRLAALAVEVLPTAYADGRRLALEAHASFATVHRPRPGQPAADPSTYLPAWRGLCVVAADAGRSAGDDALAADLTEWADR
ncbi:hypothetical protein [Micromonospora sp. NBC_01813]|uniref:hypothetical protein n=1 Tax=Micromonospora sp. NBC_01813 TaxID=2975988 RepID=UPI002DDBB82F|nr:hypothetical protein [Micromonospora sp. NBC_01813]WSA06219.1 hypothetical protein OG958_17965 [Micromonospora sp. NBC_01813]